jgi:hypothetical protein
MISLFDKLKSSLFSNNNNNKEKANNNNSNEQTSMSEDYWRSKLTPEQFYVARQKGTERVKYKNLRRFQ